MKGRSQTLPRVAGRGKGVKTTEKNTLGRIEDTREISIEKIENESFEHYE
jgi:hypothetical protein